MKNILITSGFLLMAYSGFCQAKHDYQVVKTFHIPSEGFWDYIAVNNKKVYVSHGTQVNILDGTTGDSLGVIPNTTGVHGIAFDNELNKGYTSNGRLNNVTVFDLKTNQVLGQIATGTNPDAIMYDPYSKTIITCNGRSNDMTVIDAASQQVKATTPLGGKPETAVSDGAGHIYINIEDKSEIVAVNAKTFAVEQRWSIAPGEEPTGLVIDNATKRLFAGCGNKLMIVMDATNGKVIDKLPIGQGCDGVAFDPKNKIVFSSNGEGTITAVREVSAGKFQVMGNFPTKRGARTIAIDETTGTLYLPTADFEQPATPQTGRPKMIPGTFQVLMVQ